MSQRSQRERSLCTSTNCLMRSAKYVFASSISLYDDLHPYGLCKLAADTELPVKNGAELLDRLIKDIVTEQASTYVSVVPTSLPSPVDDELVEDDEEKNKQASKHTTAFSLARFIPLLRERIYVLNPFTRTYLVSWLTVLDSVPELELVNYLPDFLDGLLKFLGKCRLSCVELVLRSLTAMALHP
jgi:hypothetical protein